MISILGAGRSSLFLIEYLAEYCSISDRKLLLCDREMTSTAAEIAERFSIEFIALDINDPDQLENIVRQSELVVSMLPAFMHPKVAVHCLKHNVHLATASYISPEMAAMSAEVKQKNLLFMNELGLDPGIDHMSAMAIMDDLKSKGAVINSFRSYCGGLIADEDDGNNPWKYKFSWNPRNVILAAQGAPAQYLENGILKIMPYQRIFNETETFNIEGYGQLEAYPNRDSNQYKELYGLDQVHTLVRGTLRKTGYGKAWHVLLSLGLTDDTVKLELKENASVREWLLTYLPSGIQDLKTFFRDHLRCDEDILEKLAYIGFFSEERLPLRSGTSAQILEELLKRKWLLLPDDKDLVVMLHQIGFIHEGQQKTHESVLIVQGESGTRTAMAKTVGLPLAIACHLFLENKIEERGVVAPMNREFYEPILKELQKLGIAFSDKVI